MIVDALTGFSRAYIKLVSYKNSEYQHEVRIVGIKKGSAIFNLQVFATQEHALAGIEHASAAAAAIVGAIAGVIHLTKHLKGKEGKGKPAHGGITVENSENVSIVVSTDIYTIYQEGIIRQDLNRLSAPLKLGEIDNVSLSAGSKGELVEADIQSGERGYFEYETKEVTTTKEIEIIGRIISLNKERNGGSFRLQDGVRIGYHLKSDSPEMMYSHLLHKGLVRVKCMAHLDENLQTTHIDIMHIQNLQPGLFQDKK
jgi:hypothetical protein